MAERSISANLLLKLTQWAKGWQQASKQGQDALKQLQAAAKNAGNATEQSAQKGQNAFQKFTNGVKNGIGGTIKSIASMTLAFVGAQMAMVALQGAFRSFIGGSVDLETSLTRTINLTSVTEEEMVGIRKRLMELAPELGKSPNELAEGFYFAASAIDDTDKALAVLEASAKASAVGLGDTRTVADALTSAINAYNLSAEDAGRVTDILLNTVKYGKMEPEELASSLGRVLPVSSALNVSLEDLGASLAVLSNVGLSCDEAVTAVRQVLVTLINPTSQAEDLLKSLGLSAAGLRQSLGEKGLLPTLQTILEATHGNVDALSEIFPNVRALVGVLGTAGVQGERYGEILQAIEQGTGATDVAFQRYTKTTAYATAQFKATLIAAFEDFAERVLPKVTTVIKTFTAFLQSGLNFDVLKYGFASMGVDISGIVPILS